MSIFTDIFAKILAKVKGLVPGANAVSDVNLTAELDKLANGKGLEWKTSVVDFLKLIGANSSRENRMRLQQSWVLMQVLKAEALRRTRFSEKPYSRRLPQMAERFPPHF
jgi:hypothetical protein